ncbi:hypothetical protein [Halobacillus campisalis]|uniref:Uncharacterized protein n=1 Tax=Halobacillus campisalis TaxID=435909 RepID=A0ABW2K8S1_9BACI|nr:hypothetical protein [Halobacillus campisalis]
MSYTWLVYLASRKTADIVGGVGVNIETAKFLALSRGLEVPAFSEL